MDYVNRCLSSTYKLSDAKYLFSSNVDFLVKLSKVNYKKNKESKEKTDSSNLSLQITVLMFPN